VDVRELHRFLIDDLHVKKRIGGREFEWLEEKISKGAVPHHSFHVLNAWRQSTQSNFATILKNLDECRVSAGTVIAVSGSEVAVMSEPLIYLEGKFQLGAPVERKLIRRLESEYDIEQVKPGQTVSIHWGVPCEVITADQAKTLRQYTLKNIDFANLTI
jgi:hypothetical protein